MFIGTHCIYKYVFLYGNQRGVTLKVLEGGRSRGGRGSEQHYSSFFAITIQRLLAGSLMWLLLKSYCNIFILLNILYFYFLPAQTRPFRGGRRPVLETNIEGCEQSFIQLHSNSSLGNFSNYLIVLLNNVYVYILTNYK